MRIPTKQDLEKLSVYEAIDYIKGLEPDYIPRPVKPILKSNPISTEAKEYAEKLEQYEAELAEYKVKDDQRGKISRELLNVLEDYLKDEADLYTTVPKDKQNKVWNYAWQQGHSSGYGEVYGYLVELVELFE
jgi:uncharacterized protein YeeX (DUF496 family)